MTESTHQCDGPSACLLSWKIFWLISISDSPSWFLAPFLQLLSQLKKKEKKKKKKERKTEMKKNKTKEGKTQRN